MTFYPINPVAAPRMTRSDTWKHRPVVDAYFSFRDEVKLRQVSLPIPSKVIFWMPMWPSWSAKKKLEMDTTPHLQTPDIDNLLKALLEAVFRDCDARVWSVWSEKRWSSVPGIEVITLTSCLPPSRAIKREPLFQESTLDLFKEALR